MAVKIELTKKMVLKDYTLIEGFPGIGLVGTIASGYLVEKLNMEPIGYVYSDKFPPMTTIHKGRPYFPARIYMDRKNKLIVLLAEFVIPSMIVYEISEAILDFVKENKIKSIISLAGMKTPDTQAVTEIYGIAANAEMEKFLDKNEIKLIKEGITTGVSGVLISLCASRGVDAVSLLSESKYGYPDPTSAANLLEKVSKMYGLKIDTADLRKEATKIEEKMKVMIKNGTLPPQQQGGEPQQSTDVSVAAPSPNFPSMYE